MKKTILALLAVLVACSSEPPIEVAAAHLCEAANSDKTISTIGYLEPGLSLYCSSTSGRMECGLNLVESPGSATIASANIKEGNGKNAMPKVEGDFADIKFKDNNGNVLSSSDKVKITGKLRVVADPTYPVCYMNVTQIEKP